VLPGTAIDSACRPTYKKSMAYAVPRAGDDVAEDLATAASIRRYEERLAKDPNSPAFAPLADLYRKVGRTQEAIALCRDGLERFPGYGAARLVLARVLADEGAADAAMAEVQALVDESPANAAGHRLAAELHRRAGRLDQAVTHLRQAVALDPTDREARIVLEALDGAAAPPEGSALRKLLVDDTFVTPSFGDACLAQGLVDEAAHVFVRVLRRDPGHARARERLEEALRVKTQRRKGL